MSLTEDQMRRLRAEARGRRVPIAEVVRDAVDRAVPQDPDGRKARFERLMATGGRFRSASGDISIRHDEILGEGDWCARHAITAVFALDANLARPGITLLPAP